MSHGYAPRRKASTARMRIACSAGAAPPTKPINRQSSVRFIPLPLGVFIVYFSAVNDALEAFEFHGDREIRQ